MPDLDPYSSQPNTYTSNHLRDYPAYESMDPSGIIYAWLLDGKGGGRLMSWPEIRQWEPKDGQLWLHMNYADPFTENWLIYGSELDERIVEVLLQEEIRPRTTSINDGLLMSLRGINLNPQSEPEDMVSLRLWADQDWVITTRQRQIYTIRHISNLLRDGKGPETIADFITELSDELIDRMADLIDSLDDRVEALEEDLIDEDPTHVRQSLAQLRKQTIELRRYLTPEREALTKLSIEKLSWLDADHRLTIREVGERLIRYLDDINAVRERAALTQEELLSQASEHLNNRMYVLSVISAIFLPLGFLTGLLGINVGGIPGSDNGWAFWIFLFSLIALVGGQFAIFKWRKWF